MLINVAERVNFQVYQNKTEKELKFYQNIWAVWEKCEIKLIADWNEIEDVQFVSN